MATIAPIQEAIAEKIEIIDLTEEKTTRKGFKPLFVIAPVAIAAVATTTFFVVRRFRNSSNF